LRLEPQHAARVADIRSGRVILSLGAAKSLHGKSLVDVGHGVALGHQWHGPPPVLVALLPAATVDPDDDRQRPAGLLGLARVELRPYDHIENNPHGLGEIVALAWRLAGLDI